MKIGEMVSAAKKCVWLNPGTYMVENPLMPQRLEDGILKLYMYGATLIIQSPYMFDTASTLMLMGGKIIANSSKFNKQTGSVYMQGTSITNSQSFLNGIDPKPVPAYFSIS